ncbi:hypothetical protein B0O80DRAFT_532331 [Mortierella sp. GBAus27b]|nr:hypothetical protein BGX31_002241 [Mortierella sp. GBA43]KAI8348574.1 hypothetical protein B0O80DRAFT_532331 [Mortierella sp. GBAus27b]
MVRSLVPLIVTATLVLFQTLQTIPAAESKALSDGNYTISFGYQTVPCIQTLSTIEGVVALTYHLPNIDRMVWQVQTQKLCMTPDGNTNQTVTIQNRLSRLYLAPQNRSLPASQMLIYQTVEPYGWRLAGDGHNSGIFYHLFADMTPILNSINANNTNTNATSPPPPPPAPLLMDMDASINNSPVKLFPHDETVSSLPQYWGFRPYTVDNEDARIVI